MEILVWIINGNTCIWKGNITMSICQAKFKLKIKSFYICKDSNLKRLSLHFVTYSG